MSEQRANINVIAHQIATRNLDLDLTDLKDSEADIVILYDE